MDVIVDCAWFNNTKWNHARNQLGRLMTRDRKKKRATWNKANKFFVRRFEMQAISQFNGLLIRTRPEKSA